MSNRPQSAEEWKKLKKEFIEFYVQSRESWNMEGSLSYLFDRFVVGAYVNNQRWISVAEKLPDAQITMNVIVHKHNGSIMEMTFFGIDQISAKPGFYWYGRDGFINQTSQVTHWMYKPDPPITESELKEVQHGI